MTTLKMIKCEECNKEHMQSLENCSFIDCTCGETICGSCGSTNIGQIDESNLDLSDFADDNYWCTRECKSCGHQGCGWCV